MAKPISLSIFFPVYNEQENIRETIIRTLKTVENSPYIGAYEILIINDGSTDNSARIARTIARNFPQVKVIDHPKNLGYGEALKTGIERARMDYVFFTDADRQFDIVELQNLVVRLDSYPVVIGYRAPRNDPFMRRLNAWGWNVLNRVLFGLKVRDIDCAFKVFRREEVQKLDLRSSGAMINAETLIRLIRGGVPIKEVPVSHLPRVAGSATGAKPSVIYRALKEMIGLYWGELGSITQKQVLKYMTVGVINTLFDVAVYIVLTRGTYFFSEHLTVAKFFSFFAGTVTSLILNRLWTFGIRTRPSAAEVIKFYAMTSVSLVVNVVAMNILVGLGLYDLYALAVVTVFTFAVGFTLSKVWVFRQREPESPQKVYAAT